MNTASMTRMDPSRIDAFILAPDFLGSPFNLEFATVKINVLLHLIVIQITGCELHIVAMICRHIYFPQSGLIHGGQQAPDKQVLLYIGGKRMTSYFTSPSFFKSP